MFEVDDQMERGRCYNNVLAVDGNSVPTKIEVILTVGINWTVMDGSTDVPRCTFCRLDSSDHISCGPSLSILHREQDKQFLLKRILDSHHLYTKFVTL